jgi:hypothetical protein
VRLDDSAAPAVDKLDKTLVDNRLSLPEIWFLLKTLLLQPTMSSLLGDGRPQFPSIDAQRFCPLARNLAAEILALRHHQLLVLQRSQACRRYLTRFDRLLWVLLSRTLGQWRRGLVIVKPATVMTWHRRGFRLFWTLEEPPQHGAADGASRDPRADSNDVDCQSTLGRAS